jgi:hypothetical protein
MQRAGILRAAPHSVNAVCSMSQATNVAALPFAPRSSRCFPKKFLYAALSR